MLTRVVEVKQLTPKEAAASHSVRLRGVVTVALGGRNGAFLQDDTGGIFIGPKKGQPFFVRVGDWVECVGSTAPGQYAPRVNVDAVEYLGHRPIADPVAVSLGEFAAGTHDAEWVETRGTIRSVKFLPDNRAELQIATGRERLRAIVCDVRGGPSPNLLDAEARLAGAPSGYFSADRQLLMPVLFVPDWSNVVIERPAPGDPFAAPLQVSTNLFRYAPDNRWSHLCRLRGVVLHFVAGKAIFIRDEGGAIYVETRDTTALSPGDVVEVAGFPASALRGAYLQDAIFRVVGSAAAPPPLAADPARIVEGKVRPGELVAIDGVLMQATPWRERVILTLQSAAQSFEVHLDTADGGPDLPGIGSRLHVTGIVWPEVSEPKGRFILPEAFQVLARSRTDLVVLAHPSWLTQQRLAQIAAFLLVTVAAALVWIGLLRRRVAAQSSMLAEKMAREAIAEERAHTACELHDTLAQSFTAVAFQMEALSRELENPPSGVRQHLERIMKMLRHSHEEVRHSLKQLRSPMIQRKDLAATLRETLERGIGDLPPERFRYRACGVPFPLQPATEHNIVRVGQEAATNALKHAQAASVEVELSFEPDAVRLRVADDGCGFNESQSLSSDHFGLQIMRERARKIGGQLQILSRPGAGTQILLAVPRPRSA